LKLEFVSPAHGGGICFDLFFERGFLLIFGIIFEIIKSEK